MSRARNLIETLALSPHPEGGFYRRIAATECWVSLPRGDRPAMTAIHYLLQSGQHSRWHRLQSDEHWFHHEGSPLLVHTLGPPGGRTCRLGGRDSDSVPWCCVPADTWFAAELADTGEDDYGLVSCVVSPGFDFADWELGDVSSLVALYPQHSDWIRRLA